MAPAAARHVEALEAEETPQPDASPVVTVEVRVDVDEADWGSVAPPKLTTKSTAACATERVRVRV